MSNFNSGKPIKTQQNLNSSLYEEIENDFFAIKQISEVSALSIIANLHKLMEIAKAEEKGEYLLNIINDIQEEMKNHDLIGQRINRLEKRFESIKKELYSKRIELNITEEDTLEYGPQNNGYGLSQGDIDNYFTKVK